jgi:hypothetical protein
MWYGFLFKKTEMCEEKEVKFECENCQKLLCENCSTKHSQKKKHQTKSVGNLIMCHLHSKNSDYICLDCIEYVCLVCTHPSIQANHSNHKFGKISDLKKMIESKAKSKIVSTLSSTEESIKINVEKMEKLNKNVIDLNEDINELKKLHNEAK